MKWRRGIVATALLCMIAPSVATAFPFGGQASIVLPCIYNSTIYVNLGPPRGGEFVWTTATRTYQFGPPRYAGQWLLGLAGAPYFCIYQKEPLTVYTAISISMMGSSGTAAPSIPLMPSPTPLPTPTPPPAPTPTPTPTPNPTPTTIGHIVVSEIYYAVDAAHGTKPLNEWVEIFNGSVSAVNLTGWSVADGIASDTLPAGMTIAPGAFVVITGTSTTRTLWNIPQNVQVASLGSPIGDGLGNAGDRVILRDSSGTIVDAVSWGTNTSAFNPSVPVVPYGHSMARATTSPDTNTARDWFGSNTPVPGK